jgi:hypothetical protein
MTRNLPQVDWTGYDVFDPEVDRPLQQVGRKEAKRHFDKLMAEKEERKALLAALMQRNEGPALGDDDASISALDHWFRENVEPDPTQPHRLLPEWYSVVTDMALHLGDVAIARSPRLRWELYVWGRKNANYQRPVLMGFDTSNSRYNVDLAAGLAGIGLRQVKGMELEDEELVRMRRRIADAAVGVF